MNHRVTLGGLREASDSGSQAPESKEGPVLEEGLTPCEVHEWVYLCEGDRTVVQRLEMYPKVGVIDVISDESLVFWVSLDNGEGRIMVSPQECVRVWQFSQPTGDNPQKNEDGHLLR